LLSNFDLEKKAKYYRIPNWNGVVMKDQLPDRLITGGWIINMENKYDKSGQLNDGSHWIALHIDPNYNAFYFDSFGFPPPISVLNYCKRTKKRIAYNSRTIQNINSSVCGLFSLTFLVYMCRKNASETSLQRFEKFINLFSDNVGKNAEILRDII
jgi:hypothetical protein